MSILSALSSGVIGGVAEAADRFIETPDEKAAQRLKERAQELQPLLAQIDLNKTEAQHASVFVAGARPATLWLCAGAMGAVVLAGIYATLAPIWGGPSVDTDALWQLYLGVVAPVHLGLLGLRTAEKHLGKARNSIKGVK